MQINLKDQYQTDHIELEPELDHVPYCSVLTFDNLLKEALTPLCMVYQICSLAQQGMEKARGDNGEIYIFENKLFRCSTCELRKLRSSSSSVFLYCCDWPDLQCQIHRSVLISHQWNCLSANEH